MEEAGNLLLTGGDGKWVKQAKCAPGWGVAAQGCLGKALTTCPFACARQPLCLLPRTQGLRGAGKQCNTLSFPI